MINECFDQLQKVSGPCGDETQVASVLQDILTPFVDEVFKDALGNLYAVKNPVVQTDGPVETIMLSAHMDEPTVTVIDIDDAGFIRVEAVGKLQPAGLIGARVRFARTGRLGVIGAQAHVELKDIAFRHLFVDVAAQNKEDAMQMVKLGDFATLHNPVDAFSTDVIVGPSLDSKVSCAILVDILQKAQNQKKVIAVFTVQKQAGSRGAHVAGFRGSPDLAVTIDLTKAGDTPNAERPALKMGDGPAIKMLDAGMVVAPSVRDRLVTAAKRADVAYQFEVAQTSSSDTGALFISRGGIRAGGVSVVARYASLMSQMIDTKDVARTIALLTALLE